MYRPAFRAALPITLAAPAALLLLFVRPTSGAPPDSLRLGVQEVSVEVDDRQGVAVTTVHQELVNRSRDDQPGSWSFTIPQEAALLRYQILAPPPKKNERPEQRASLESGGHGTYRLTLHRVPRRGKAQVEVVYAEGVVQRGVRRKYAFPILAPEGEAAISGMSVRVAITAASAPRNVVSTTHPMLLRRPFPRAAAMTYVSDRPPDGRDLVVDYEVPPAPQDEQASLAVLSPADPKQDPYFLLRLPPPAALLHESSALDRPADIVFCLDVSGSTAGRKLNAIEEAIHDGLTDLSPRDRFGVVAFDDDVRTFRKQLVPARREAAARAIRFVNRIRSGGGSDPGRALRAAVQILGDRRKAAGRAAVIAIVVDSDDPADLGEAAAGLDLRKRGIRLATLGAQNDSRLVTYRLRGTKLRAGPAIALSRAAVTYGPSLAGAAFDAGDLNASYVYPAPERLPDLPLSTPIVLMGRLNQPPPASGVVTVRGKIEGKARELRSRFFLKPLGPGSPVPALWAARRIRRLDQLASRERGDEPELTAAARRVQAEHGLPVPPP
jgi:hypothetical protein